MKIVFLFSGGRREKLNQVRSGSAPSEFLYGYWELLAKGKDVHFLDVPEETQRSLAARILNLFYYRWQLLPCRATGDLLVTIYRLGNQLKNYDILVATTTGIGFCLEILRWIGILKVPILTLHCGVLNHTYNRPTEIFTGCLLRRGYTQVFGIGELEEMKRRFSIPDNRITLNEFGVDTQFWTPSTLTKRLGYVLAVGNDGLRDYELLMSVAQKLRLPVKLLTTRPIGFVPENVTVLHGRMHSEWAVSDIALRELYREAAVVVVPLIESFQPSGQSVTLQAMACGTAVVLTRTAGLWNRQLLRDRHNCLLVPVADEAAMVMAVHGIMEERGNRDAIGAESVRLVRENFPIQRFVHSLELACHSIYEIV